MRESALNKEAKLHRLQNQRRISYHLIDRARHLLKPGVPFTRELHELFRSQGKFGSKDRRLYRELIYTFLRFQPWLEPLFAKQNEFLDRLIVLAAPTNEIQSLYLTLPERKAPELPSNERFQVLGRNVHQLKELFPDWLDDHASRKPSLATYMSLASRPPLWLRIQKDPSNDLLDRLRAAANPENAKEIVQHPLIPRCVHAPADFALGELPCYLDGSVEIQDISSQILLNLMEERPKGHWLDACAGAGGKTLQLAETLLPSGKVDAFDTRPSALRELQARSKRSGFPNISILDQRPTRPESYDGVLVDAPCSGSGTWRRHPYLIRQTREQDVFKYANTQLSLLKTFAPLVKSGGSLVYSTCSLSRFENEGVVEKFLSANPEFKPLPLASRFGFEDRGQGITVHPEDHNGDGLYIASFRKL